jgi:hypothetical protein
MAGVSAATGVAAGGVPDAGSKSDGELKKVFTEFAAGTFYKEMLGSLRKGAGKPAYFDGSYAEDVFRAEMDRHIADNLASEHGEAFAGPLYDNFARQVLGGGRK